MLWSLLVAPAVAALPGAGYLLPGAVNPVRGTGWLSTGPLVYSNQGVSSVAWSLRGAADLTQAVSVEGLFAVAQGEDRSMMSVQSLSGRVQVVRGDRFRLSGYGALGVVGWGQVAEAWPLVGMAMEAGSSRAWVDTSLPLPLFLVGVETWDDAPVLVGLFALSEVGINARLPGELGGGAEATRWIRIGKELVGPSFSLRTAQDRFFGDLAVAGSPMEDDEQWTWMGQALAGMRY